jgi:ERCC4-type nuclease|uniref:ERCC4 domain-containing protein n=1 Tax=viral metagenome TaxID=1070528 RepID=A0A6C0D7Z3_9ZZZZ
MKIRIDNREHELIRICKHLIETGPIYNGLTLLIETLPIGDIIISENEIDKLIIERKSLGDLAASIKDGRYEEQSYRLNGLNHHNHNIIYLIEGDINKLNTFNAFKERIDKTTIYSSIFSLNHFKGFSVLRTMNIEETALMICNMAYKLNKSSNKLPFYSNSILKNTNATLNTDNEVDIDTDITNKAGLEQHYCNVVKKVKKDNITPENIGEIMLCQIPGISSTSAIAIMNKFKTIQNLIINLRENDKCLQDISYSNSKGQQRKVNKTVISNIIKFLKN